MSAFGRAASSVAPNGRCSGEKRMKTQWGAKRSASVEECALAARPVAGAPAHFRRSRLARRANAVRQRNGMEAKIHRGLSIKVDGRGNLGGSSTSGADFHGAAAGKKVLQIRSGAPSTAQKRQLRKQNHADVRDAAGSCSEVPRPAGSRVPDGPALLRTRAGCSRG